MRGNKQAERDKRAAEFEDAAQRIEAEANRRGYTVLIGLAGQVCMKCGSVVHPDYEQTHTQVCPGRSG